MLTFIKFIQEGSIATSPNQPWGKVKDADDLKTAYHQAVALAEKMKPRLNQVLKRASSGQAKILLGIKSWESFSDKVLNRGKASDKIHDVLRSAVLTSTQQEAEDVASKLKKTQHVLEYEFKDKGQDAKYGYYGSYHLKIVLDGLICEVQVMTRRLWAFKGWGHEVYQSSRSSGEDLDTATSRLSKNIFAMGNKGSFIPNRKPSYTHAYESFKTFVREYATGAAVAPDVHVPAHSLGISRDQMPQIKSDYVPEFLEFLAGKGVHFTKTSVDVSSLYATQKEINKTKVAEMIAAAPERALKKPVITTDDHYILDGHHRWLALLNKEPHFHLETYRIHTNIHHLLQLAKEFPKTKYKTLDEDVKHFDALTESLVDRTKCDRVFPAVADAPNETAICDG